MERLPRAPGEGLPLPAVRDSCAQQIAALRAARRTSQQELISHGAGTGPRSTESRRSPPPAAQRSFAELRASPAGARLQGLPLPRPLPPTERDSAAQPHLSRTAALQGRAVRIPASRRADRGPHPPPEDWSAAGGGGWKRGLALK